MIVKNVILTDEQRKGFILLANSPDPFGNYLYSSELDLIMNKQTRALMTYYWDDKPDGYEIPFDKAYELLTGIEMPRKYYGKIKFIHNEYKIKSVKYTMNFFEIGERFKKNSNKRYPTVIVLDKGSNTIPIHRITGVLYIPNSENKPFVNHKGIEKDYAFLFKKEDLNWVTPKENSNMDKKPFKTNIRYMEVNSEGFPVNEKLYTISELLSALGIKSIKFKRTSQSDIKKYRDKFYKKVDLNLINYKEYLLDSKYVTEEQYEKNSIIWKSKVIDGVEIFSNLNGVLKYNSTSDRYLFDIGTVGSLNERGYSTIQINKKCYNVHTIICFIFSDNFNDFSELSKLEVDHINSDPRCNLPNNLRFVNHTENMNNKNTLNKRKKNYRRIKQYSLDGKFIKEWDCAGDIAKYFKYTNDLVCRTASRKYEPKRVLFNFLWCYKGDEEKIKEDMNYIYYRFDSNGNIIDSGRTLKEVETGLNSHGTYLCYINTGIPAPDGYYYQQGVVFLKDINGEKNVRLIELI